MPDDLIEIRSSRFWALFHFNLTRWIFPSRMLVDHIGVSTNIVRYWLIPWRRIDEHLPLSHIAEVTHIRGWDSFVGLGIGTEILALALLLFYFKRQRWY